MLWAIGVHLHVGRFHRPHALDHARRFQYHDTYFVVAHSHTIIGGSVLAIFGAVPLVAEMDRHMYDETLGKWHFWLPHRFPPNLLPAALPRAGRHARRIGLALQFTEFNQWSTVRSFLVVGAQLVFFVVFRRCAAARSRGKEHGKGRV